MKKSGKNRKKIKTLEKKNNFWDFVIRMIAALFGLSVVLDHYQIIRHKMSYIFSIFECSENGHFLDTLLFLLNFSKSFAFIVH